MECLHARPMTAIAPTSNGNHQRAGARFLCVSIRIISIAKFEHISAWHPFAGGI